jgi:hypothetical protein
MDYVSSKNGLRGNDNDCYNIYNMIAFRNFQRNCSNLLSNSRFSRNKFISKNKLSNLSGYEKNNLFYDTRKEQSLITELTSQITNFTHENDKFQSQLEKTLNTTKETENVSLFENTINNTAQLNDLVCKGTSRKISFLKNFSPIKRSSNNKNTISQKANTVLRKTLISKNQIITKIEEKEKIIENINSINKKAIIFTKLLPSIAPNKNDSIFDPTQNRIENNKLKKFYQNRDVYINETNHISPKKNNSVKKRIIAYDKNNIYSNSHILSKLNDSSIVKFKNFFGEKFGAFPEIKKDIHEENESLSINENNEKYRLLDYSNPRNTLKLKNILQVIESRKKSTNNKP